MGRPKKSTNVVETQEMKVKANEIIVDNIANNKQPVNEVVSDDDDTQNEYVMTLEGTIIGDDDNISQTFYPVAGEVIKVEYPTIEEYISHIEKDEEQLNRFLSVIEEKFFTNSATVIEPPKPQPKVRHKTYEEMMGIIVNK